MSQYIIQTRDLTKTYGEQKSVSNLNMHVRKGKIYGLLGRNGAGKTTTMKMLLNLIEPTSGSIRIFNRDISRIFSLYTRLWPCGGRFACFYAFIACLCP